MAGAIEHQARNEKQRLCRNASQAISDGQATKQDVGRSLKARRFGHSNDDQKVTQKCENTKGRVNTSCNNIVDEGRTVIGGKGDEGWQAAGSGNVALISHSLVSMTTYVRTEA